MARGGPREGAGRKAGATTRKTREIADKANEEGITPLEVMLGTMRELWRIADEGNVVWPGDDNESDGEIKTPLDYRLMAVEVAQKAAPFVHAKLANVQVAGDGGGPIIHKIEYEIVDPSGSGTAEA